MKTRITLTFLIVVFGVLPLFARKPPAVSGRVLDSEGAAIADARVLVHWDNSGTNIGLSSNVGVKADVSVNTDQYGRFQVSLPPGFYDVFVSSPAFSPVALKIRVKEQVASPLEVRLRADPLVMAEIACSVP